jgi:hypothetical protein
MNIIYLFLIGQARELLANENHTGQQLHKTNIF